MEFKFDKKEGNKVFFDVEITWDEFKPNIEKAYLKNRSKYNIPGFRKGKAPLMIIEANYGKGVFYDDTINIMLDDVYKEALDELKLDVVDVPSVDIKEFNEDKNIVLSFSVDVRPEFTLPTLEDIELEDVKDEFSEDFVDAEIERLRNENARYTIIEDRKTKNGDVINFDFKGYVDNKAFEGGEAKGYELEIGSKQFIPGFEEQLVDRSVEEEFDVNVKFPEEYHSEDLKGKDAKFLCTIHEIKEKELPQLDDDFAADVSDFESMKEYKDDLREKMKKDFEENVSYQRDNLVMDKLNSMIDIELPERMVEDAIDDEIKSFETRLQYQGVDIEHYKKLSGNDDNALRENFRKSAEKRVKSALILDKVIEDLKLEVLDDDYERELEKLAKVYGKDDEKKFIEEMKKGSLKFLDKGILNGKALDEIKKRVKFK